MRVRSEELRRSMPALVAGFTIAIVFTAVLSIVLTIAGRDGLNLADERTRSWIAFAYGLPSVLSIPLLVRYRMPLLLTGNVFALIFVASLGDTVGFPELSGAAIVAGAIVLVTTVLGVAAWIAAFIPAPIVQGLIAGAVLPFVIDVFSQIDTSKGSDPLEISAMVGAALVAYLVSLRVLGSRFPAIVPAFLAGLLVAASTGQLGALPNLLEPPGFTIVPPEFSWTAILTVTPVFVAIMIVQSNVPSVIYLRTQGFDPPEWLINLISGAGTMLGSLFGPVLVSLALPPLLLAAAPTAGDREIRYRAMYVPIVAGVGIALLAGAAAEIALLIPPALLLTVAGLALLPALIAAIKAIASGPLVLGPVFAFAIALSGMSLLGLGAFFWSLILGTLVSLLVEPDGWRQVRSSARD